MQMRSLVSLRYVPVTAATIQDNFFRILKITNLKFQKTDFGPLVVIIMHTQTCTMSQYSFSLVLVIL